MYKTKYGKVVKSNTHGDSQEIWIKELNPLMFWKTYKTELGVGYKKLLECDDIVKFMVDEQLICSPVVAVKALGQDLDVKDLFEERVK